MNMITGGSRIPEGGEWRSPDSSLLDLEEVDGEVFHVTGKVVMDDGGYGIESALSSGPIVGKQ
jgi:hypothetical protein